MQAASTERGSQGPAGEVTAKGGSRNIVGWEILFYAERSQKGHGVLAELPAGPYTSELSENGKGWGRGWREARGDSRSTSSA